MGVKLKGRARSFFTVVKHSFGYTCSSDAQCVMNFPLPGVNI